MATYGLVILGKGLAVALWHGRMACPLAFLARAVLPLQFALGQ